MSARPHLFCGEPMTRREVLVAREAATHAIHRYTGYSRSASANVAAEMFPLPKVTRPRVVRDPHAWVVSHAMPHSCGEVYWRTDGTSLIAPCRKDGSLLMAPTPTATPTKARVELWADLLANPTEEVEAEP